MAGSIGVQQGFPPLPRLSWHCHVKNGVYEIKVPFITAKMTSSLQCRMSSVGDCVDWLGQRPRLRSEALSKRIEPLLINTVRPLLHQPPPHSTRRLMIIDRGSEQSKRLSKVRLLGE